MTLFLDQGVPRRAAQLLRDAGYESLHAAEAGLSAASDAEIISWCRERDAIAVTVEATHVRVRRLPIARQTV